MQSAFDFDAVPLSVPHVRNHASYLAALRLATKPERRHFRARLYLEVLGSRDGGCTDREAYEAMAAMGYRLAGVSSLCSIRAHAMEFGLVKPGELVEGPFGAKNTRWLLTESGRGVVTNVR